MPKDINGNEIQPLSGFLNTDGTPIEQTNEQPTAGGQEPGGFSSGIEKRSNYDKSQIPINTGVSQIQPQVQGTELKPVEQPTPTELQLPEQKQRVYTDTGYIDMNAQDYQNYLADKAKRKSEVGTSAQEGNLTPEQKALQTQQEKTTVTTPQGTTTTVKETPKPTIDKTARNNEIVANLNEGYKNDPTVQQAINSGNFELFKSKYNMQDPEEARIVEAFYQAHQPKDTETIYNMLRSGQTIQNQAITSTPEYTKAHDRFLNYQKYSSYNPTEFGYALSSGELLPGSQIYTDLTKDPNIKVKLDKAQALNTINGKTAVDSSKISTNTMTNIVENNPTIASILADNYISPEEKKRLTSTPEIEKGKKELEKMSLEVNAKQQEYDDIEKNTKAELKGTGATSTQVSQLIADRQSALLGPLNLAIKNYNTKLGFLNDKIKDSESLFDDNIKLYQDQKAKLDKQKEEQDKLKQEFAYKYGDLKSTDPNVQRVAGERIATAIQKQYEGMPFRRDISTMGADIVREINSGKSIDQITTEITNAIQHSPDYANWKANNKALATPETKYSFIEKDGNIYKTDDKGNISLAIKGTPKAGDWKKLDDGTYVNPEGKIVTKTELEREKLLGNSYLNTPAGTNIGVECGQYARTATGLSSTPGGNSLAERKAQFSDSTPTPGGLVLFSGGGYNPTYGHIAVVTGVNSDGTINVKESNYRGDNKVTERKNVPLTYVSGFYNNTPLAGGTETGGADKDTVESVLNGNIKVSELPIDQREKIGNAVTKEINKRIAGEKDNNRVNIIKSAAYSGKLSDTTIQKINKIDTVKSQLGDIVSLLGKAESETGPIAGILSSANPYNTKAQQIKALLTATVPNLARGVFGEVGVLTDNDIANYTKTMPNLKSTAEVNKLITDMLQKTLAKTYMDTIANAAKGKANVSNYLQDYDEAKSAYNTTFGQPTTPTNTTGKKEYSKYF